MNPTRRRLMTTLGVGLTTLAGCAGLENGEDQPTFDPDGLIALGEKDVPEPPTAFPVTVPESMATNHLERARSLLEAIPSRPDIPNGALVEYLHEERNSLLERLDDAAAAGLSGSVSPLRALAQFRRLRGEAANLEASYRAAKDELSKDAVQRRREQLRADRLAFDEEWAYRGGDPPIAAIVHATVEALRWDVEQGVEPTRAFPADPPSDVRRAGEVVAALERGRAALSDAEQLRARYVGSVTRDRALRSAISIAAGRLRGRTRQYARSLEDYVGSGPPDESPFDRSIEGTVLEHLFHRAAAGVQYSRRDAEAARHRGHQATDLLETGKTLARLRALDWVVNGIRAGTITPPESVDELATRRAAAIEALEQAWSTAPTVLSASLGHWAWVLVEEARDHLRGTGYEEDYTPDTRDAHAAFVNYTTGLQIAAAIPRTTEDVRSVFEMER